MHLFLLKLVATSTVRTASRSSMTSFTSANSQIKERIFYVTKAEEVPFHTVQVLDGDKKSHLTQEELKKLMMEEGSDLFRQHHWLMLSCTLTHTHALIHTHTRTHMHTNT